MCKKTCSSCKQIFPLTPEYFGANGKNPSGSKKWKARCHKCSAKAEIAQFKQRVADAVGGEDNVRCWNCGYNRYFGALDFHHLTPSEKEYQLSHMKNYSAKRINDEIAKCVILCRVCHAEVHAGILDITNLQYNPR